MKKIITLLILVSGLSAHAEFGVSAGASFNYKADFRSSMQSLGYANNPGAPVAGVDHFYDDGYNRVDSSGNDGNLTSYWGYQNASQDNGGSVTMSSKQTLIDSSSFSREQSEAQPAFEFYWQQDLTENQRWNIGLRAALRWQHIDVDSLTTRGTTIQTTSDTYPGEGIPPGAPFSGSYSGPNFLLSDIAARDASYASGTSFLSMRELEADLFALDFGPTFSYNFTEKLRLSASIGGTVAWLNSDFTYRDGPFGQGRASENEWLLGAYAGADLSYRLGDRWGLFGGAAYTCLEDSTQEIDGRSASFQFDDSYTVRFGLFFR